MKGALCAGATALMFPDDPEAPAPVFCRRCPVQVPCLERGWAEDYGVWGGLSESERLDARLSGLDPLGALRAYRRTPIQDS